MIYPSPGETIIYLATKRLKKMRIKIDIKGSDLAYSIDPVTREESMTFIDRKTNETYTTKKMNGNLDYMDEMVDFLVKIYSKKIIRNKKIEDLFR